MKKLIYLLVFLSIVICTQLVFAQDSMTVTKSFFSNHSPSLLFHVSNLNLAQYEGGIGMAFYGSDDIQWRLSVGVGYSYGSDENERVGGTNNPKYRDETIKKTVESSMSAAPLFVINHFEPGFIFWSPSLNFNYQRYSRTTNYWDSLGVHSGWDNYEKKSWGMNVGVGIGAGINFSNRIAIAGEYRVLFQYSKGESDGHFPYYSSGGYIISQGKTYNISLDSSVLFTLFYKL